MESKEWFEKSKYVYSLDEHDESVYLCIDENKVAEMLDEYYQYKLKLLGLQIVSQQRELLVAWEKKEVLFRRVEDSRKEQY
jgi:hypothetical protein